MTTRTFPLTIETGPQRLPILITAFAHVPAGGRPRSIEQLEVEASIKERLFAISALSSKGDGSREYAGGDQSLPLAPGEVELLRQRIVEYPFWNPLMADVVAETYRWLGTDGAAG